MADAGRRLQPEERRRQIIQATIDTVATLGYRAATFARIAERGGLSSTRLISYHFGGRDDLMMSTVGHVYEQLGRHVSERLGAAEAPRAELAAYIRAVVGFIDAHRTEMQALSRIFISFYDESGAGRSYDADTDTQVIATVADILRRGQDERMFRDFDIFVMASLVQRSVDGLPFLLQTRPDLNLDAYADELVETFDIATRS